MKLFTIAPMYRYGAPGRGRYREHWQASVEAIGTDDPAIDAELIQLYDTLLGRLGVTRYHLELNSIGCRECRPAYLETLRAWLAANGDRLDEETRAKVDVEPAARVRQLPRQAARRFARRSTRRRRSASRSARRASSTSRPSAPTSTRPASATRSSRRSCAASTTTRARLGVHRPDARTRTRRSPGGGRYDYLVEEIGGPPTPGVGFGAGIERLLIAMEEEGVEPPRRPGIDVFFALETGAPRVQVAALARRAARAPGSRAETDYAGRSLKGQLTQARRLGRGDAPSIVGPETRDAPRAGAAGRGGRARRDRL